MIFFERVPKFLPKLKTYIRLTRWEDYASFLQFVLGFFLAKNFSVSSAELILLGKALFVLAPLLYGGIYTLNNIKDAELDRLNPKKKDRPIPAGEITKEQAGRIALALIGSGLLLSLLLPPEVFLMALSFLAVNIFYTFWAKAIPYLEIATNSVPHVGRLLFGMWLGGNLQPAYLAGVLATASIGAVVFRRIKEIQEGNVAARPVLKFYPLQTLRKIFLASLVALGLFVLFGQLWEKIIGGFFLASHLITGLGYSRSKKIKRLVDFAWR